MIIKAAVNSDNIRVIIIVQNKQTACHLIMSCEYSDFNKSPALLPWSTYMHSLFISSKLSSSALQISYKSLIV